MYKSLLPQCCVNKGSDNSSTCTSPYCHSAVSIRFFTTPLHVQVLAATVLCQYCFYNSSTYMYKSLLPQCCVNKGSDYPSTCTNPHCHRAVSILFLQLLYMYKSLLPQCCVNKGSDYPSTCTSPCCHSAVSIKVITTPLHAQFLTATLLCQKQLLPTFHLVHILKRHLLNCVAP